MKCANISGQMEIFIAYKVLFLRINIVGNSVAVHIVSPGMDEGNATAVNSSSVKDEIGLQIAEKFILSSLLI